MESNKNKKTYCSNMGKSIITFFLLLFSILSVSATNQELLKYGFEEGSGSIVLDGSGSGNHAVVDGGNWDTTAGKKTFGLYSFKLTNDDSIRVINDITMPNEVTFVGSIYIENEPDKNTILQVYAGTNVFLDLSYDATLTQFQLRYRDSLNVLQVVPILSTALTTNTLHNIGLVYDYPTQTIKFYLDDVEKLNSVYTLYNLPSTTVSLIFGEEYSYTNGYKGNFDNFRLYNFVLNQSEINQVLTTNVYEIPQEEGTPTNVTEVNKTNIINWYSPIENQTISNQENIEVNLVKKASCQLYLENELVGSYNDVLGFVYGDLDTLNDGEYTYFVYCEYVENETRYYELTNEINFNIQKPSKTVEFFMYDQDGNLLSDYDDLYLVTPCFESNELSKYFIPDREVYIQQLVNGQADFNLSYDANYEFCLLKGKVNAKDDFFSLNYDLLDVTKQTELGKLFVNNETYTYSLKTDDTDLYKVTQPEFWGKTWSALFQMIMGLLVGSLLIFIGLMAGNDKIIVVGGLVIAIGMGVSITTFVGAII